MQKEKGLTASSEEQEYSQNDKKDSTGGNLSVSIHSQPDKSVLTLQYRLGKYEIGL